MTGIRVAYQAIDRQGAQQVFRDLRDSVERLQSSNFRLISSLNQDQLHRAPTETESQTVIVATECADVARDLLKALGDLDVPETSRQWSQRLPKLKAAIKAVLIKKKLEGL
jgi:hypothetical protein